MTKTPPYTTIRYRLCVCVLFVVVCLFTLQGNVEFQSAAFASRDPPLGEGWDEEGNDLSKIANDVSLTVSFF